MGVNLWEALHFERKNPWEKAERWGTVPKLPKERHNRGGKGATSWTKKQKINDAYSWCSEGKEQQLSLGRSTQAAFRGFQKRGKKKGGLGSRMTLRACIPALGGKMTRPESKGEHSRGGPRPDY